MKKTKKFRPTEAARRMDSETFEEFVLKELLDWYWHIKEPGNLPDHPRISNIVRNAGLAVKK